MRFFDPTVTLGAVLVVLAIIASSYAVWIKLGMRMDAIEKISAEQKDEISKLAAMLGKIDRAVSFIEGKLSKQ